MTSSEIVIRKFNGRFRATEDYTLRVDHGMSGRDVVLAIDRLVGPRLQFKEFHVSTGFHRRDLLQSQFNVETLLGSGDLVFTTELKLGPSNVVTVNLKAGRKLVQVPCSFGTRDGRAMAAAIATALGSDFSQVITRHQAMKREDVERLSVAEVDVFIRDLYEEGAGHVVPKASAFKVHVRSMTGANFVVPADADMAVDDFMRSIEDITGGAITRLVLDGAYMPRDQAGVLGVWAENLATTKPVFATEGIAPRTLGGRRSRRAPEEKVDVLLASRSRNRFLGVVKVSADMPVDTLMQSVEAELDGRKVLRIYVGKDREHLEIVDRHAVGLIGERWRAKAGHTVYVEYEGERPGEMKITLKSMAGITRSVFVSEDMSVDTFMRNVERAFGRAVSRVIVKGVTLERDEVGDIGEPRFHLLTYEHVLVVLSKYVLSKYEGHAVSMYGEYRVEFNDDTFVRGIVKQIQDKVRAAGRDLTAILLDGDNLLDVDVLGEPLGPERIAKLKAGTKMIVMEDAADQAAVYFRGMRRGESYRLIFKVGMPMSDVIQQIQDTLKPGQEVTRVKINDMVITPADAAVLTVTQDLIGVLKHGSVNAVVVGEVMREVMRVVGTDVFGKTYALRVTNGMTIDALMRQIEEQGTTHGLPVETIIVRHDPTGETFVKLRSDAGIVDTGMFTGMSNGSLRVILRAPPREPPRGRAPTREEPGASGAGLRSRSRSLSLGGGRWA